MIQVHLLLLSLLLTYSCKQFQIYTDYNEYISKWRQIVPPQYIHNATSIIDKSSIQKCYDKRCQFFYFESQDKTIHDNALQKTVLLVSGMHGNEILGPHTLLNSYKLLKGYKIIYFPVANPSGFLKRRRETVPGKIDPNRDYPIDNNTKCYQTTATHIIDMLYRTYKIDLTIVLHNGGSQISFNWGTYHHKQNSHTEQYDIYLDIARMMGRQGGFNKKLDKFAIGTMDEVIYPATGTFDDWAYAAGKYNDVITKCQKFQYKEYSKDMANGLVFLIEMGPFQTEYYGSIDGVYEDPQSQGQSNGYIARGIRILRKAMNVVSPKILIQKISDGEVSISVSGCHQAEITALRIYKGQSNEVEIFKQEQALIIEGDLREDFPIGRQIKLPANSPKVSELSYDISFQCDKAWKDKGTTTFSKPRIYTILKQPLFKLQQLKLSSESSQFSFNTTTFWEKYQLQIILITICLIAIALLLIIYKRCSIKRKIQKFEQIQKIQGEQQEQGQQQLQGDLYTARGGIIQM